MRAPLRGLTYHLILEPQAWAVIGRPFGAYKRRRPERNVEAGEKSGLGLRSSLLEGLDQFVRSTGGTDCVQIVRAG